MAVRVLADGVFDPLHAGHLAYLRAAAKLGGELVVQVSPQRKRPGLMPQEDRAAIIRALGYGVVSYQTTAEALIVVKPDVYAKGDDWAGRELPIREQRLCADLGIRVAYVPSDPRESSTRLLTSWAAKMAHLGAAALNTDAQAQVAVPFDPVAQGYDSEKNRKRIEGQHPDILAKLCAGKTVLDVGCGPGYLVKWLRKRGVEARGVDPNRVEFADEACFPGWLHGMIDRVYDVVVCREVLEHLPVREWGTFLSHLFRVARERVYLTTRFHLDPPHPYALTDERAVDPSHITVLPQPFLRALCTTFGGVRDTAWEAELDWLHKDRVLVYKVTR